MLALAFIAAAGGVVLLVAGVTGSTIASAAKGKPDHANATTPETVASTSTISPAGKAAETGNAGQVVYSYLTKQGLTAAQAAGVVGNLQQESSLNPAEPGGGLAQWIGSRWSALVAFAGKQGASPDSAALQAEYLWHELTTSERGALTALKKTTTPQQAARVFSEQYERPSDPQLANRERYATEALSRYA
ncbi:MAG TPA: phage tail tip lysozyme [Solirubrobacteraceae bacterium]|nr:phage tail tip lysozyme [Solirubrobacteraceae bacterium]